MMSTTARYSIKPKTLTLLELSQSMSDIRHPPSNPSYQYESSPNTAQILNRRLYLHPLTINPNGKQQLAKLTPTAVTSAESEQRSQSHSDKNREIHPKKTKSSTRGLAILSSSFPLITRTNLKTDLRHSRDKMSAHTDDDANSDFDSISTTISFNQPSLLSLTRGTLSSTRAKCNRPSYITNHRKTYTKPNRLEKINAWHNLNRALEQPRLLVPPSTPYDLLMTTLDPPTTPVDLLMTTLLPPIKTLHPPIKILHPPTTPFGNDSDLIVEKDESENDYLNYNSIQGIQIYKRNPREKSFIIDDDNYDDYLSNEE